MSGKSASAEEAYSTTSKALQSKRGTTNILLRLQAETEMKEGESAQQQHRIGHLTESPEMKSMEKYG